MSSKNKNSGYISAINGSLIEIKGLEHDIRLHDLVKISNINVLGEAIQIYPDKESGWHIRDFGRGLSYQHLTQKENDEKLNNPHVMRIQVI